MTRAPRFAAIDVGSNTVHLLVASCPPNRLPIPLLRRREFVQLGQDVNAVGAIGPERLELASRALRRQVDDAREAGVVEIAIGATQALRSAANGREVADRLSVATGAGQVRILSSEVEAQLAFDGATMTISPGRPTVVLDIGGASTQIAGGPAGARCRHSSLGLGSGSVALFARADPPGEEEWHAMERRVSQLIPDLIPLPAHPVALGTGGTITNLPRLLGKQKGAVLRLRDVEVLIESFHNRPATELAERSGVDLERTRLCRGGALILAQIMDLLQLSWIRSSERGLRDGMIAALVRGGEGWWHRHGPATVEPEEVLAPLAAPLG
ncbi:MAG: Ppx/GppA phosphatase family protein [Candidatus Dormibacteria bacterium]